MDLPEKINKDKKKEIIFISALMIIYAAITLLIVMRHEPWRDEAQAWLISRDLPLSGIISQMKYEGHPALWSLLLMPFAKLNLPYLSLNLISWVITCAAAFILLKFAPFGRFTKFCILSGSAFLYLFPVISRSYAMFPLLIFAAAALYHKQKKYPVLYAILLILLANTNVIMLGFVGALSLLYFKDSVLLVWKVMDSKHKKINLFAFFLMILGLLSVYLQLKGSLESNSIIDFQGFFFIFSIPDAFINIPKCFFGDFPYITSLLGNGANVYYFATGALILLLMIKITGRWAWMRFLFVCGLGFQMFIYVFVYQTNNQRAASILLMFLFCVWIGVSARSGKEAVVNEGIVKKVPALVSLVICVLYLLSLPVGIQYVTKDWNEDYSSGKSTAAYIKASIPKDAVIIAYPDFASTSVMPYLPGYRFWMPNIKKYATFITWNSERQRKTNPTEWIGLVKENFRDKKNIYFLISSFDNYAKIDSCDENTKKHYLLVYQSGPALVGDEMYRIYRYEDLSK